MNSLASLFGPFPSAVRATVERSLAEAFAIEDTDGSLRITTACAYPSGGLVRVTLRGGALKLMASDEGEALGEALGAGIVLPDPEKLVRPFVMNRGLSIRGGVLSSDYFSPDEAAVAVAHVANVAKDLADWLYAHGGVRRRHDFKKLLSAFLLSRFKDQVTETRLLGASQKSHKFPAVISFANGRKFIVDPVINDPASINARVVANLDVKARHDPLIQQRIIYDDAESWTAADIALLQVGATVIPFSRSQEVIERIAEETRTAA
ncbi:hypothetical protein GTW51_18740 [Aurantimonas aggregata]|uniref:DUF1828 domain-containing protein n=1 Tax=Aurantimonas aggregata TaxID=2047720 RepID=A0A6L9MMJ2_9HYPH|nr:hypothetical protein [Aurantimonas aggregata]NDV88740.1 hypothetical protein [Aurantimonas aggregata]